MPIALGAIGRTEGKQARFAGGLVDGGANRIHRSQAVRAAGTPVPACPASVFGSEDDARRACRVLFGDPPGRLFMVQPLRSPDDAQAMLRPHRMEPAMNPCICVIALMIFDRASIALLAFHDGNPFVDWLGVSVIAILAIAGASVDATRQAKINERVLSRLDELQRGRIRDRDDIRARFENRKPSRHRRPRPPLTAPHRFGAYR